MMRALVLSAVLLCNSSWAADPSSGAPADAPTTDAPVTLTPKQAHDAAVRVLTCEKDLSDCAAAGKLEPKWLVVGVVAGVLAGVGIGAAAVKLSEKKSP